MSDNVAYRPKEIPIDFNMRSVIDKNKKIKERLDNIFSSTRKISYDDLIFLRSLNKGTFGFV